MDLIRRYAGPGVFYLLALWFDKRVQSALVTDLLLVGAIAWTIIAVLTLPSVRNFSKRVQLRSPVQSPVLIAPKGPRNARQAEEPKRNVTLPEEPATIRDATSNIVYVGSKFDEAEIRNVAGGVVLGKPYILHAIFKNDPAVRRESTGASRVIATIKFHDLFDDGSPRFMFEMMGRWPETPESNEMDFPPNGAPRKLDILLKYPYQSGCYGYNNESLAFPDWRNPTMRVGPMQSTHLISVRLTGIRVDRTFWFSLMDYRSQGKFPKFQPWTGWRS